MNTVKSVITTCSIVSFYIILKLLMSNILKLSYKLVRLCKDSNILQMIHNIRNSEVIHSHSRNDIYIYLPTYVLL